MHVIVELLEFERAAKKVGITEDERDEITDFIAANPMVGDEISGTGGVRKVRFAAKGKGKSGGYRIITFFSGSNIPAFLITIYAKGKKDDLSQKEKKAMKVLTDRLIDSYTRRKTQ